MPAVRSRRWRAPPGPGRPGSRGAVVRSWQPWWQAPRRPVEFGRSSSAVLLLTGSLALAASPAVAAHTVPDRRRHRLAGPLRRPGFPALLGVVLATSLGLGAIDVTIAARAVQDRNAAAAGYVLAALGLGSALGGLLLGKLRLRARTSTQMIGLLLVMTAGWPGPSSRPTCWYSESLWP